MFWEGLISLLKILKKKNNNDQYGDFFVLLSEVNKKKSDFTFPNPCHKNKMISWWLSICLFIYCIIVIWANILDMWFVLTSGRVSDYKKLPSIATANCLLGYGGGCGWFCWSDHGMSALPLLLSIPIHILCHFFLLGAGVACHGEWWDSALLFALCSLPQPAGATTCTIFFMDFML